MTFVSTRSSRSSRSFAALVFALTGVATAHVACSTPPVAPTSHPVASASAPEVASSAPVAEEPPKVDPPKVAEPEKPKPPFNVLLITIDSMRADMPWAGYSREIAPRLTALQKKAITYTNAYSISSFTSKSVGGLLGGRYPSELKRTGSFFTRYLDENETFPEMLTKQGVYTMGGHAHAFFGKGESGFEQGFADWRIVPGITFDYNKDPYVTSQKMTPMAIDMLSNDKVKNGRFFAWFHYMDPHDEYKSHSESPGWGQGGKAGPRALYDEEIFYTDLWIGKLLDWVETQKWASNTVIIVSADHGEAFGEHKLVRHAFELYEMLVHVPMFMVVPGQAARTIDAPRSHIDLVPTMMELMGTKPGPELSGKSFMGELFGGDAAPRDIVCDLPEDSHNERRRSFRHGDWKIIAFANDFRYELYNLKDDPGEKNNLIKKDPDKAKEMISLYKEASKNITEVAVPGGIKKHK
ncbi:MAG: sulfatase-like hydrolase/transferase [Polyangiaceae bacterium]